MTRTLASLLFLLATPAFALDAYLVAGQSNGWRLSQLAAGPADPDGARVHYFGMPCVSEPESSKLKTLAGLSPKTMGYGLAVSLLAQSEGEDIVFIQFCRCGAPVLGEHPTTWWPGRDPRKGESFEGGLFGKFALYLADARRQVKAELGEELEFKGIVWHQGESNISSDEEDFETAMGNVFWRLRQIIGEEKLPIVAGHIRDLGEGPKMVNGTLDRLAKADPKIATVPLAKDIVYERDGKNGKPNVHIANAGCQLFGLHLAEALAKLRGE